VSAFETIVVPTDFSENARSALATAVQLCSGLNARLSLVHVVPASYLRAAISAGLLTSDDTDETVRAKVNAQIEARFDELMQQVGTRCAVERTILHGDPGREITEYLRSSKAGLVVVGRRGITLADVILGSVAEKLVRHAPCPVVVVRRDS
jgi:nucleotide-binding universal stress UspA family protein